MKLLRCLAALIVLLVSLPLSAATFLVPSDAALVERADAIVLATIEGSVVSERNGHIETTWDLRVGEVLKGPIDPSKPLALTEMGGFYKGRFELITAAPSYESGERAMIFLARDGWRWRTWGMRLGKFSFSRGADGVELLVRGGPEGGISGLDESGHLHSERPRPATAFKEFVQARLRGEARSEAPVHALPADQVRLVTPTSHGFTANSYQQLVSAAGETVGFRWQQFDFFQPVIFLTKGTQLNSPGAVDNAMAAWNGDPNSPVALQRGGTSSAGHDDAGSSTDRVNVIEFNSSSPSLTGLIGFTRVNGETPIYSFGGGRHVTTIDTDLLINASITSQALLDAVVTHEIGHALGIRHSEAAAPSTVDAIMYVAPSSAFGANLRQWDGDAITHIYGSGVATCPSITQQPQSQTITVGQSITLSVVATGTEPLSYQWFKDAEAIVGERSRILTTTPAASAGYFVMVTNGCGSVTSSVAQVVVNPRPTIVPVINSFTATPGAIAPGQSTTLAWSTTNAIQVFIGPEPGAVAPNGSASVSPQVTTTYTLAAGSASGDVATGQVTVTVSSPEPRPLILSFTASPSPIALGGSSTLFFSTSGAATVTIDNGVGNVPASGSVTVTPSSTTVYTLTATAAGGSVTATAMVEVLTQPAILVARFPSGLLQAEGTGGATDRYVLLNIGGSPSSVTLGQTGPPFFTQSPTSFTIAPGASQTVILTGLPQPTGSFEGTATPTGSGVPAGLAIRVRLLSAAQPQPGTIPRPTPETNRVDVTTPTGSLEYTNNGNATLNGILVSDVPWIIPQSGVITIPPGQTVTLTFTIDRSKRPDGDAPNGSVTGNMTLVYLLDAGTASGSLAGLSDLRIQPMDGTPPTGSRPITVVDTAAPVTSANAVPPYAAGEIGFFMPGFAQRAGIVSDLAIVNALSPTPLSNAVRLFYATSGTGGAAATSATISTLPPNISVQFGSAVKTVFNRDNQTGSLQVRSQSASDKLSLSAGIFSTRNPRGFFGGTLPVFRSDRSARAGEKLYLAGVRKDGSTRSDLYLQETAGLEGSVRSEFVDAQGGVLKTETRTVPAFGMIELTDAAPTGAVSVIVTNLSATGGRIAAHAVVLDSVTNDAGSVVDWNRKNGTQGSEAQLIPLAETKSGPTSTRTEVIIMNSGSTTASGVLKFFSTSGTSRKRGVSRGGTGSGLVGTIIAHGDVTVTLEPGRTRVMSDALGSELGVPGGASGYLVFTPASGSVAITSRTVSSATGQPGSFGAAIPAVALSAGLAAGRSRQFTGIEDAAPATVASRKVGTFRSGFGLVETLGKSVTVRTTLRYAATVPGGLANVRATASKEYLLAPRGALTVTDLGRAIFGAGRDAIGDLHNLQLDFNVVSGEGAVVPYTLSTDNGSGDSVMRIE